MHGMKEKVIPRILAKEFEVTVAKIWRKGVVGTYL
jgi:hypothetical protein